MSQICEMISRRTGCSLLQVMVLSFWTAAGAMSGAGQPVAIGLALIGALMIWPTLALVDDARPETALAAFKRNAIIGAAVLLAFSLEPIWRTVRPHLGM